MDVCGIDPGIHTSGYAVVRAEGACLSVLDAGVCRTDAGADLPHRVAQIEADFAAIFEQWPVETVAVEQLYAHYKHPRTAVLMGHARGVIIATASRFGFAVRDYSATQIKRFLTGNGHASKAQVQSAVMGAFGLQRVPEPNDVADALATAYCCIHAVRQEAVAP
ncbi:MAG TPA: crossover junction endodeoxyribonuclease RuvC [Phycisphaerae bacterium]|nr:crossover junction endodeoxyribonuclease RuvC [Phycisphaerae bacterium]